MSILKPGIRCVIIAGCPENIGLVVEIIERLGAYKGRDDAYYVRTVTGRNFHQLWDGGDLLRGNINECVTDRHKLRPLVDLRVTDEGKQVAAPTPGEVTA